MSVAACAEIVRKGDPDRFRVAMAAPVPARARLFPLYAFNVEIARAPWVSAEPMIGEMRLQWWRDALEEIGAGGRPRAHEVVGPLAEVIRETDLSVDGLDRAVAARRWDLWREPFADADSLSDHIDATAGELMAATARALGEDDQRVRDVGWAGGLAGWFLAVPNLEARGLAPLPGGESVVRDLAAQGLERIAAARARLARSPAVPALRAAWRAPAILARARREPDAIRDGRLAGAELASRLSFAVKVACGGF